MVEPMKKLEFTVTFHTAYAVDQGSSVPGTVIKGMMLDAARDLGLTENWAIVRSVFGGHDHDVARSAPAGPTLSSPWSWSDLRVDGMDVRTRSRIRIDPDTGTVADGAIVQVNEFGQKDMTGSFTIKQTGMIPQTGDSGLTESQHLIILEATARSVTSLGASRRRGLGWVSITRTHGNTDVTRLAEELESLFANGGTR